MGMKAPKQSMALTAPAGVFPARLARIIEIGEHDTGKHGIKDQVFFFYNLVTQFIEQEDGDLDGKQYQVRSRPMKNSSSQRAALWEHRKVTDPDTMEFSRLLGKPVFVTTEHNEVERDGEKNTYCNLINVSGVPAGIEVPELDITAFHFDFDAPDADVWENEMWDWIRDKIKSSLNYSGSAVEEMVLRLDAMNPDNVEGESE